MKCTSWSKKSQLTSCTTAAKLTFASSPVVRLVSWETQSQPHSAVSGNDQAKCKLGEMCCKFSLYGVYPVCNSFKSYGVYFDIFPIRAPLWYACCSRLRFCSWSLKERMQVLFSLPDKASLYAESEHLFAAISSGSIGRILIEKSFLNYFLYLTGNGLLLELCLFLLCVYFVSCLLKKCLNLLYDLCKLVSTTVKWSCIYCNCSVNIAATSTLPSARSVVASAAKTCDAFSLVSVPSGPASADLGLSSGHITSVTCLMHDRY